MITKNDLKKKKNETDDGSFNTNLGKYEICCHLGGICIEIERYKLALNFV